MTPIRLPALIHPHVHVREPGATFKEDWNTLTAAALAGGFIAILAMPDTTPPVADEATLTLARHTARARARCDLGLHLGAGADNVGSAASLASQVAGPKLYLDRTYGPLNLEDLADADAHFKRWPHQRPLLCHAEGTSLAAVLALAWLHRRPVHICHVSRRVEVALMQANPARIFRLSPQSETWIEVDPAARWEAVTAYSRARWTPFAGMTLTGRVTRVVLRGADAFRDGRVLATPGSGRDLFAGQSSTEVGAPARGTQTSSES